jgi:hypothetical protein
VPLGAPDRPRCQENDETPVLIDPGEMASTPVPR